MSVGSVTITDDAPGTSSTSPQPYYFTPAQMASTDGTGIRASRTSPAQVVCVGGGDHVLRLARGHARPAGGRRRSRLRRRTATATTLPTDIDCAEAWQSGRQRVRWLAHLDARPPRTRSTTGYPVVAVGDPVFFEPLAVCFDNLVEDNDSLVEAVDQIIDRDARRRDAGTLQRSGSGARPDHSRSSRTRRRQIDGVAAAASRRCISGQLRTVRMSFGSGGGAHGTRSAWRAAAAGAHRRGDRRRPSGRRLRRRLIFAFVWIVLVGGLGLFLWTPDAWMPSSSSRAAVHPRWDLDHDPRLRPVDHARDGPRHRRSPGRLSTNPVIYAIATLYVSLVRGTPLLVQIFFAYYALPQAGHRPPADPDRHPRARLQLRRVHDRDLPCRHPGRSPRPERGGRRRSACASAHVFAASCCPRRSGS